MKPYTKVVGPRLGRGPRQGTEALTFLKGSSELCSQEKPWPQAVQQDKGIYKERDEEFLLLAWEEVGFTGE